MKRRHDSTNRSNNRVPLPNNDDADDDGDAAHLNSVNSVNAANVNGNNAVALPPARPSISVYPSSRAAIAAEGRGDELDGSSRSNSPRNGAGGLPFFHSPTGTASAFNNNDSFGRHPTFHAREGSGEALVVDGAPVAPEKQKSDASFSSRATATAGLGRASADGKHRQGYGNVDAAADAGVSAAAGSAYPCRNNPDALGGRDGMARPSGSGSTEPHGNDEPQPSRLRFSESFVNLSYVKDLPEHLMPLANEIHQLDEDDLAYISEVTHTMANRDLYSLLPYTGSNWFLPSIRECEEDEKHWELKYTWKEGLIIAIGGRRLSIRLLNVFIRVCVIVLVWFMLWNMLPHYLVEPGGYVWDPAVLVVVSAIVGGLVCRILQLPPLVGVLWVGIMWNNIPSLKYLTHGIVKQVFDICSKLGLTVILARAGYKLAVKEILPHWKQTALLATLPFAFEGVAHSLVANKIFDYNNDYNWAFLQGMLCSIVSPAVVVPGSLYLQDLGYGHGVGPLSLMLSAVGIEIVIGVWTANFIIGLIFYNQKLAVAIVLGPVQFAGGILIGIALGVLFYYIVELIKQEANRLPNGKYTREHLNSCLDFSYCIFLCACYTMVFLGYHLSLAGGGCVMCVFFSATVAHMWARTGKAEHEDHKKYVASWLAFTWDQAMMPILFATMGAKINVKAIFNSTFFPKALICMAVSTAVRLIVIFAVQLGSGMPYKEKLLVCVGYLGKASAQASIGPIPANLVATMLAGLPTDQRSSLDTLVEYANNVQQISAMYVMFMACVASLGLVRGGQAVLKREGEGKKKKSKKPRDLASAAVTKIDDTASPMDVAVDIGDGSNGGGALADHGARGPTWDTSASGGKGIRRHESKDVAELGNAGHGDHHVSFVAYDPPRVDSKTGFNSDQDRIH